MKRYRGWWCAWCSTWVAEKDIHDADGQRLHLDCGNVVEKRSSEVPIQTVSPTKEVRKQQVAHRKMARDFVKAAM